jgi:tetratricopeptide (TPR) repeat protein
MAGLAPQHLWNSVRRARLFRVLAVYLGGSFAVIQIVDIFTDQVGLPDWVFPGAVVLLLIGLPIIIATALVQGAIGPAMAEQAAVSEKPVPEVASQAPAADITAATGHWLTWRKAILGGVLAFALLGVTATTYMSMRVLGIGPVGSLVAKGVLDERDRIVLADFEDHTADPELAATVTETFRIDLAQSPTVTLVQPRTMRQVLARMQVDPEAPFDRALASEAAVREGIKAVVAGEINTAGSGYVLSVELVSPETGDVLVAVRETAADSSEVIPAIDKLSERLRERIGESLKSIRANEPLEKVTTASLEALRKYTQAERAVDREDFDTGIRLLEEATSLDTAFAMAYRKLGVALSNRGGETTRRNEALGEALRHRERLTDRESYLAEAAYYDIVTNDRERAIAAYRTLLETYPTDITALNNLGILYFLRRDFEGAEQLYQRALEQDSFSVIFWTNSVVVQAAQGRWSDAEATLQGMAVTLPGHPRLGDYRASLASARGSYDEAETHLLALREEQKGNLYWRSVTSSALASIARTRGQLAVAEGYLRDEAEVNTERGLPATVISGAVERAWLDVWFRGEPARGLQIVEAALERQPLSGIPALDRPYLGLAWLYAWAGQADRAKDLLDAFEAEIDPAIREGMDFQHAVRGTIALAEGRANDAIAHFQRWDARMPCPVCASVSLGTAYDAAGIPDSVLAIYERYSTTPWLFRSGPDSFTLPIAYERLANLYEQRGDRQKAIHYYGKLVELLKDADPELQPRVEAARRAMEALSSDR